MLKLSRALGAAVLATSVLIVPAAASASPTRVTTTHCTTDSKHYCIKGGEFCPKAKANHKGTDAKGHVYICKAGHWRKT